MNCSLFFTKLKLFNTIPIQVCLTVKRQNMVFHLFHSVGPEKSVEYLCITTRLTSDYSLVWLHKFFWGMYIFSRRSFFTMLCGATLLLYKSVSYDPNTTGPQPRMVAQIYFICLCTTSDSDTVNQAFYYYYYYYYWHNFQIVHVEWESRAIFLTIYDDLYKTYQWGICITLNLFVALTSS